MIRSSPLRKNKYILRQFTITKAKQLIFKKKKNALTFMKN